MIENNLTEEEIRYAIRFRKEGLCGHAGCPVDEEALEDIEQYEWLLDE